jgi:hypothetical protein
MEMIQKSEESENVLLPQNPRVAQNKLFEECHCLILPTSMEITKLDNYF